MRPEGLTVLAVRACQRANFVRLLRCFDCGDFQMRGLIIGMTGSTGAIFGVRMLEALKDSGIESHLIISKWAQRTLEHETRYTVEQVRGLATVVHSQGDMGASISSGSFKTEGMVVMPCSVHTLAGIANG